MGAFLAVSAFAMVLRMRLLCIVGQRHDLYLATLSEYVVQTGTDLF